MTKNNAINSIDLSGLTYSAGGIPYSTANQMLTLAGTTIANQVLLSGNLAAPTFSIATYPSTTVANQLLYSSATNTITGLSTLNNAVLITSGAGIPLFSLALPNSVQVPIGSLNSGTGATNTTFWRGDGTWGTPAGSGSGTVNSGTINQLAYYASSGSAVSGLTTGTGVTTALGVNVGSVGAFLTFNGAGGTPSSITLTSATGLPLTTGVTGILPVANGGTNLSSTTINQILYSGSTNTIAGLATANSGVLVTNSSGVPSISTGGQIPGTTTNNSASAGNIGELISSVISTGSAISLTTTVVSNVTSISLTAGDWNVWGNVTLIDNVATISSLQMAINSTSATLPDASLATALNQQLISVAAFPVPSIRVSLSSTTTYYLVATATFASGTVNASGGIYARRAR